MTREEFESLPIGTRVKFHTQVESCYGTVVHGVDGIGVLWEDNVFEYIKDPALGLLSTVHSIAADEMIDGLRVSKDTLCYHLIPEVAMQRLCERISLGEQTKGNDAWNAMSDNQSVLESRKALARRFGHLINHSYRLLGKIQSGEEWTEDDEREASAVMWGGMFAICAIAAQRKSRKD